MANTAHRTKKDIVVEVLREAIACGELEPGERLLQNELAERLNVSPTPIREALGQLEAEGVLSHIPHRGVRVSEVKLDDVREIYLIRSLLEQLATRYAVPRMGSLDVHALKLLQAQIDGHIAKGELTKLRKPDHEFHMLIYRASGMPHLQRIISYLWTRFPWDTLHVLPGRPKRSAMEHSGIIQAIEEGNADLAAQRMHDHIEHAAIALAEHLENSVRVDLGDNSGEG